MLKNLHAFLLGIVDGWQQPHYLSMSLNVDHLHDGRNDPWGWQDRGINAGQWVRSPRHHQREA